MTSRFTLNFQKKPSKELSISTKGEPTIELFEAFIQRELVLLIIKRGLALPDRLRLRLKKKKHQTPVKSISGHVTCQKNPSNHLRVHVVVNPNQAVCVSVVWREPLGLDDAQ